MGNYRGRIDIIADILRVAEEKVRKTQIMYKANLSYTVLQKYLAGLTNAYLIVYEESSQYYLLTDKGREYLNLYKEYSKANRHIEKRLTNAQMKKRELDRLCSYKSEPSISNQATSLNSKNRDKEEKCLP